MLLHSTFTKQYHSPQCWAIVDEANDIFLKLKSETARLGAVKEQILIRYLGSGWVKAHHSWSENGNTFISRRLFNHFLYTVIPLTEELDVPEEPPLNVQKVQEIKTLGTVSELAEDMEKLSDDRCKEMRRREIN